MLTSRGFSFLSGSFIMLFSSAILFPHPPVVLLSLFLFFTSAFYAIIVHSSFLSKIRLEDFTIRRDVSNPFSIPGKEVDVEVEIVYRGGTRILCVIEDSFDDALTINGKSTWSGTLKALSSTIKISYSVSAPRRGVYLTGPVVIKVTDEHGLCSRDLKLGPVSELVFMPPVKKIKGIVRGSKVFGSFFHVGSASNPFTGPEEDFVEVREYTSGDLMKHIDWKAVARSSKDQIYVRMFDKQEQADVLLVLCGSALGAVHEKLVEVTASFAKFFIDAGDRVGLLTDVGELVSIYSAGGRVHLRNILRMLSRATCWSSAGPIAGEVSKVLTRMRVHCIVILVGWPKRELMKNLIGVHRGKASQVFILTPTYSSTGKFLNIADPESLLEEVDATWEESLSEGFFEGFVIVRAPIEALEGSLIEAMSLVRRRRKIAA